MKQPTTQAGFTLVELMLAMVVTGITVGAALGVGFAVRNSYHGQRRAIVVERTARASMELMSRAVRAAMPGVATGNIQDLVGCSTFKGIEVGSGGASSPDRLSVIWGAGAVTSVRVPYDLTTTDLTVLDGSSFRVNDYALVTDFDMGHLVQVLDVTDNSGTWALETDAPSTLCGTVTFPVANYPVGSLVIRARMGKFFILADNTVGNWPTLMFDPDVDGNAAAAEPIAPGVEDLQIAVGVDTNGDGQLTEIGAAVNDDEWFYNFAGENAPPTMVAKPWRALRITVTARAAPDGTIGAQSSRPAAEDRTAGAADQFRRRTLSTTIEIRNSQGSP